MAMVREDDRLPGAAELGEKAERAVLKAMRAGEWVLLQNCHLAAAFLLTLEKLYEKTPDVHYEFRLWLTTQPTARPVAAACLLIQAPAWRSPATLAMAVGARLAGRLRGSGIGRATSALR